MADAKAEGTSEKKQKSSTLDDDLGNDILTSWKSMAVTKDAEDFNLEPMVKTKKKDFSFDKFSRDMDFDIGGDFGQISSFKMDMSDLDFSFPSKKNKKSTETAEGDSGKAKFQRKDDRFNFSFDFNLLDNFDVDATLSKVDTFSSKKKDNQMLAADRTDVQILEIQVNEVTNADIANKPKRGQPSENVAAGPVQVLTGDHETLMTDNHPLCSEVSDDVTLQLGAETLPDEPVYSGKENSGDHSSLPADQPLTEELDVQSMPKNNLGAGSLTSPLEEGCSSKTVTEVVGGDQNISLEEVVTMDMESVRQKTPKCVSVSQQIRESSEDNNDSTENVPAKNGKVPDINIKEVDGQGSELQGLCKIAERKTSELSNDYNDKNGTHTSENTSAHLEEYSGGISDSHEDSVASCVKIPHIEMKTQVPPLSNREHECIKSSLGKENESKVVRSNFFGKSDDTNKLKHKSSNFIKPDSPNMSSMLPDSLPEKSEANACEKHVGVISGAGIISLKEVTKGENTLLRNQITLITAKENSLQISSLISKAKTDKKVPQKSDKVNVTSIADSDCTQAIRHISVAKDVSLPIKSVTRNLDLSDLKTSRCSEERKLQSFSAITHRLKSFKDSRQKVKVVESATSKITGPNLIKLMPGTTTLKRKQAPTGGLIHQIPLKRLSQSPKDNSNNVSDMRIHDQVQHKNNIMDVSTSNRLVDMPRIATFDAPGELNLSALKISAEMGNYEMVEKAASYGKDLDDLCNMLKKKNEEAKELLVRAVVNNNNLLLLNHPMHNAKSVQKLANRLMAMEIVARQVTAVC